MHINLETDYAIRIVDVLAQRVMQAQNTACGCRIDAKAIADISGVPLRFALKILGKLTGGSVVRSYKGVHGGYELAREPSEISLYDVVSIVEGDYSFSRCLCDGYNCSRTESSMPCKYQHAFAEISDTVKQMLKQHTFAQEGLISNENEN